MIVFRVAHPEFVSDYTGAPSGPYNIDIPLGSDFDYWFDRLLFLYDMKDQHADTYWHTPPQSDPALRPHFTDSHVCGFVSLADLQQWFDGWLGKLHDAGFRMYVYESDDAADGMYGQAVFAPKSARLVETRELATA